MKTVNSTRPEMASVNGKQVTVERAVVSSDSNYDANHPQSVVRGPDGNKITVRDSELS